MRARETWIAHDTLLGKLRQHVFCWFSLRTSRKASFCFLLEIRPGTLVKCSSTSSWIFCGQSVATASCCPGNSSPQICGGSPDATTGLSQNNFGSTAIRAPGAILATASLIFVAYQPVEHSWAESYATTNLFQTYSARCFLNLSSFHVWCVWFVWFSEHDKLKLGGYMGASSYTMTRRIFATRLSLTCMLYLARALDSALLVGCTNDVTSGSRPMAGKWNPSANRPNEFALHPIPCGGTLVPQQIKDDQRWSKTCAGKLAAYKHNILAAM